MTSERVQELRARLNKELPDVARYGSSPAWEDIAGLFDEVDRLGGLVVRLRAALVQVDNRATNYSSYRLGADVSRIAQAVLAVDL